MFYFSKSVGTVVRHPKWWGGNGHHRLGRTGHLRPQYLLLFHIVSSFMCPAEINFPAAAFGNGGKAIDVLMEHQTRKRQDSSSQTLLSNFNSHRGTALLCCRGAASQQATPILSLRGKKNCRMWGESQENPTKNIHSVNEPKIQQAPSCVKHHGTLFEAASH